MADQLAALKKDKSYERVGDTEDVSDRLLEEVAYMRAKAQAEMNELDK